MSTRVISGGIVVGILRNIFMIAVAHLLLAAPAFAQGVSVFRLGESGLGSCTGFYVPNSKQVITAGHCNHRHDFKVIDSTGKIRADLADAKRSYLATSFGPFDVLILSLSDAQEAQLLAFREAIYNPPTRGYVIAGFPEKFREWEISEFSCGKLEIDSEYSQRGIEAKLASKHLICPVMNHMQDSKAQYLAYSDVAGLSGGPVFLDGQLIGLAYHFAASGFEGQGYFKIQYLNAASAAVISESEADQKFQVNRKIFEEIKVPNIINLKFADLFFSVAPKGYQREMIQSVQLASNSDLMIQFSEQAIEVPSSKISPTLSKFFGAK